jgi:hypothetical protein
MILRESIVRMQSKANFNSTLFNFSIIRRLGKTNSPGKRTHLEQLARYKKRGIVKLLEHGELVIPDDFEVLFATADSHVQIWLDQAIANFAAEFPKESKITPAAHNTVDSQSLTHSENGIISHEDQNIDGTMLPSLEIEKLQKGVFETKEDRQRVIKMLRSVENEKSPRNNVIQKKRAKYNSEGYRTLDDYYDNQKLVLGFAVQRCPRTEKIVVVQFSTHKSVIILQFDHMRKSREKWYSLTQLLLDQDILKVGANIHDNLSLIMEQWGTYVRVCVCRFCLLTYLSVCLPVRLSVCLSVYLSICLSVTYVVNTNLSAFV